MLVPRIVPFVASDTHCPHAMCTVADAHHRQQPSRLQQQLAELSQQLEVVQRRAAAKEASSRKYKEAVRAFKVRGE